MSLLCTQEFMLDRHRDSCDIVRSEELHDDFIDIIFEPTITIPIKQGIEKWLWSVLLIKLLLDKICHCWISQYLILNPIDIYRSMSTKISTAHGFLSRTVPSPSLNVWHCILTHLPNSKYFIQILCKYLAEEFRYVLIIDIGFRPVAVVLILRTCSGSFTSLYWEAVTCVARLCCPDMCCHHCHLVCVAKTHLLGDSHTFPTGRTDPGIWTTSDVFYFGHFPHQRFPSTRKSSPRRNQPLYEELLKRSHAVTNLALARSFRHGQIISLSPLESWQQIVPGLFRQGKPWVWRHSTWKDFLQT